MIFAMVSPSLSTVALNWPSTLIQALVFPNPNAGKPLLHVSYAE